MGYIYYMTKIKCEIGDGSAAMKHPALAASGSLKTLKRFVDLIWYLSWVAAVLAAAARIQREQDLTV